MYDRFNKLYWDGKLPSGCVVGWDPAIEETHWGLAYSMFEDGAATLYAITLNPLLRKLGGFRQATLLHEMCHIALAPYEKHGKPFQEEMLRIATRGAFAKYW